MHSAYISIEKSEILQLILKNKYNSLSLSLPFRSINKQLTAHRTQCIRPSERAGRCMECLHVWTSHVAVLLTLTFTSCDTARTGSWYGAEDDCSRVLTTSSGQVMTTPTVPPTLQQKHYCLLFVVAFPGLDFWPTVLSVVPLVQCVICLWRFVSWQNGMS